MRRRALLLVGPALLVPRLLAGAAIAAEPAPPGLAALLRRFAAIPRSEARFSESKAIPELDLPLPSQGTLSWQAPDRLEKRTASPIEEVLRVAGDRLVYERPDRGIRQEFNLDDQPEMRALVEAIRGTLAGDLAALQRHYEIGFDTLPEEGWRMTLTPRSLRVRAAVQRILVSGRGPQVLQVETEGNGGVSRMQVTPGP
ncbi:outer membrane lipoprotein carrier protein LolA [Roseicella sp. DB1501]|uniref:outer membrane lipoprotein carrier protein LolA n=1 Tax=Roseicella sp. DB1501 TaxID=2730925 RepID=UPI00149291AF|nr:outer membrane lipoprotein carrier protein LolA [Roseicella sp. DB1501]NOG69910.1 outer membrane lipoprotein carrier protein LolA [Roseicella sp. DB1501]